MTSRSERLAHATGTRQTSAVPKSENTFTRRSGVPGRGWRSLPHSRRWPKHRKATEIHFDALGHVEIDVAEEDERLQGRNRAAELRLAQVEVCVAEEHEGEPPSWQPPAPRSLGGAEEDPGEVFRPPARTLLAGSRREVAVDPLELVDRRRRERSLCALGEFLQRQAAGRHMLP